MNSINALKIVGAMENACSKLEKEMDNSNIKKLKELLLSLQKQLENEIEHD